MHVIERRLVNVLKCKSLQPQLTAAKISGNRLKLIQREPSKATLGELLALSEAACLTLTLA